MYKDGFCGLVKGTEPLLSSLCVGQQQTTCVFLSTFCNWVGCFCFLEEQTRQQAKFFLGHWWFMCVCVCVLPSRRIAQLAFLSSWCIINTLSSILPRCLLITAVCSQCLPCLFLAWDFKGKGYNEIVTEGRLAVPLCRRMAVGLSLFQEDLGSLILRDHR